MSDRWAVHHGDCREVMQAMEPESIDSIVSDPPYGLSFMGKGWDTYNTDRKQRQNNKYEDFMYEVFGHALRVAKPGAHLLAFGGTRTFHRLTVAIEDAGWHIRDCLMWVYGSGFPKSHDVSKAIDREAGAEREVVGTVRKTPSSGGPNTNEGWVRPWAEGKTTMDITAPATDAARQWQGWGTALKPAWEPIILARKPLSGTVAANVLEHGTGAINVDGCRVEAAGVPVFGTSGGRKFEQTHTQPDRRTKQIGTSDEGRWPANLIHDGSDEVVGLFPQTASTAGMKGTREGAVYGGGKGLGGENTLRGHSDSGSAARFFYCAKASKRDRDEGCEGLEEREAGIKNDSGRGYSERDPMAKIMRSNHHPTVKPTDLMRYLCRLITPPDGLVFDPFTGSGSTGKAAMLEGFRFVGAEQYPEYIEIARARIGHAAGKTRQKELALA